MYVVNIIFLLLLIVFVIIKNRFSKKQDAVVSNGKYVSSAFMVQNDVLKSIGYFMASNDEFAKDQHFVPTSLQDIDPNELA